MKDKRFMGGDGAFPHGRQQEYIPPDLSLFSDYGDAVFVPSEETERNFAGILQTLALHNITARAVSVVSGAAVSRYDLEISEEVSAVRIASYADEIAMRVGARGGVRVCANYRKDGVFVEIANEKRAIVGIKSALAAPEFASTKPGALMFALGKDIEGNNVIGNIVRMKHILVAGSMGSGKSMCLNTMLVSLICKYSPEDLRLILIAPERSEFSVFEGLPHLMINEIISDAQKAVRALNWAIKEMERRYELFRQKTCEDTPIRDIDEYNRSLNGDEQKLAKIVIVVDELADLMNVAKQDIEERIQRITQKARAAGIYMVIATQRPTVDVITGTIKCNLPTRISFRVVRDVDSRIILDEDGAQKLLGGGDMLYRTDGMSDCVRVQGTFLNWEEVLAVVDNIKENNEAHFDAEISDYINLGRVAGDVSDGDEDVTDEVDAHYIRALGYVIKLGSVSISMVQHKCGIGYNHAGKIIEWMEMMGYISPFDGISRTRNVLITKEEYESKYGSLD